MSKEQQKGYYKLQLNSITTVENDPTIAKATFSIIDFEKSGNGQVISYDVANNAKATLINKPLVVQYFPVSSAGAGDDHFGNHGQYETQDKYGNDIIASKCIPIGNACSEGYFGTIIDENGIDKQVLMCDFVIYIDRFQDIYDLLLQYVNNGTPLYSSCEYYFCNYTMVDGVQHILDPLIFSGHCILNSDSTYAKAVSPAYDSSMMLSINQKEWNQAINNDLQKQENSKEILQTQNQDSQIDSLNEQQLNEENIEINKIENEVNFKEVNETMAKAMFKKVCELSFGDVKDKLYTALSKVVTGEEWNYLWISNYNVYPEYVIYETYLEGECEYFKVNYTSNADDTVTVDISTKVAVSFVDMWKEIPETQALEASVNSLNEKVAELEKSLNEATTQLSEKDTTIASLNEKVSTTETSLNEKSTEVETVKTQLNEVQTTLESTKTEKETLATQFNEVSEKLISLNEKVQDLEPIREKYVNEQMEKALNAKTEYYSAKFKAVNAVDKFNSEEVQNLVKLSINESEEGKNAILSLNTMLVDMVTPVEEVKNELKPMIKEVASKRENLIPTGTTFEERYGFSN